MLFCSAAMMMACGEEGDGGGSGLIPVGANTTNRNTTTTTTTNNTSTNSATNTTSTGSTQTATQSTQSIATSTATSTSTQTMTSSLGDSLILNEVRFYKPDMGQFKWFELYNPTDQEVDLTGWSMSSDCSKKALGAFDKGQVAKPNAYTLIFLSEAGSIDLEARGGELCLFDALGNKVDEAAWPNRVVPSFGSWGRWPNLTGEFGPMRVPTGGIANLETIEVTCGNGKRDAREWCDGEEFSNLNKCESLGFDGGELGCTNSCSFDVSSCVKPPTDVVINELGLLGNQPIELYNRGTEEVDISGWLIGDKGVYLFGTYLVIIPADTILKPGEHKVFKDVDVGLDYFLLNDLVVLVDNKMDLKDYVEYTVDQTDTSYCRQEDGKDGTWGVCATPTLGGANATK